MDLPPLDLPPLDLTGADRATADQCKLDPGWRFGHLARVRWSDCDPFGHCNHLAFLEHFQDCRNRYLPSLGLSALHASQPGPVIVDMAVRYTRPVLYDQVILVTARTARIGRTSFDQEYAAWLPDQGLAAWCRTTCVLMVNDTGEKVPFPDSARAMIRAYEPQPLEE
ncbi:MAG: acyl-CoA thioesterase [Caenispirillum sp.]|nr:acyl-CoA thioesterase [Caenispirillum sp.]